MKKMSVKRALAAVLCAATVFGMAACGASDEPEDTKAFMETTDNGVVVNLDKDTKGTGGGSGVTVGDGQMLMIDNQLTDGAVEVRVSSGGSDIEEAPTENMDTPTIERELTAEEDAIGETEYGEIEPGDYMIFAEVTEKASGNIYFNVVDK